MKFPKFILAKIVDLASRIFMIFLVSVTASCCGAQTISYFSESQTDEVWEFYTKLTSEETSITFINTLKDHLHSNQKEGAFKELIKQTTSHISNLSRSNVITEFNVFGIVDQSNDDTNALFDGERFKGWGGDISKSWRIESGVIIGGS